MSDEATEWPSGTILAGRYRVEGELGRGGMGVVLRAWPVTPSVHLRTDTPVALKLMLNTGGPIDQHRFEREARITAQLDPTGVCAVYDAGMLEDGTPYIAMELLEGEDLDDRLAREETLEPSEAVDWLLAAIDVLAEAHLAGLVHRDLKPSNLFIALTPLGPQLKVLDFGIVKVLQGEHQTSVLTRTGELLGSPAYMAPEQLMDSGRVDHRIDIWALGAVLYELLSGRPPFEGRTLIDLCQQVFTADAPRLPSPSPLDEVIARCLAKAPDDRFPNLGELARALTPHAGPTGRAWAQRTLHRFAPRTSVPITPSERAAPLAAASPPAQALSQEAANLASAPQLEHPGRPRRWWPALLSISLLVAGATFGIYLGQREAPSSGRPEEADARDEECKGQRCDDDLRLRPGDSVEPFERREAAERIARQSDRGAVLVSIIVSGVTPDGKVSTDGRTETFIFAGAELNVSVVLTPERATVHEQPKLNLAAHRLRAVPTQHCPFTKVLSAFAAQVPGQTEGPVVATLMETTEQQGFFWQMQTGAPQRFKIDSACRVHKVL